MQANGEKMNPDNFWMFWASFLMVGELCEREKPHMKTRNMEAGESFS